MSEQLTFHTVDELDALSVAELQALWELVPTDRQRAYRAAYDREVRSAGALGSDMQERRVADELLRRYAESALVPVGSRWAKAPRRVQDSAKTHDTPETDVTPSASKPAPIIAVFALIIAVVFGFMLLRPTGGESITPESTAEPSATATPRTTPTPTPLALEAQDDVIRGGDTERAVAYPVSLQITVDGQSAPRVWVV